MTSVDELSRLFEAERAAQPPVDAMERGLSRLLTDVAAHTAPLAVATGSLRLGLSVASKWLFAGFLAGLAGAGAASQYWSTTESSASSAARPAHGAVAEDAPKVAAASTEAAAMPRANPPELAARIAGRSSSAPPPAALEGATTFDEELRLIAAAKRELERGQGRLAAAWLTEHSQRFPNGVFAQEREALGILAACSTRRQPDLAQAFATKHPQSAMVPRLLRACSPHEASAPSAVDFSETAK